MSQTLLNRTVKASPATFDVRGSSIMMTSFENIESIVDTVSAVLSEIVMSSTRVCHSHLYGLSWSNILNVLLLLFVLANFKCFPLVYHVRLLNGVRHMLRSQRSPKPLSPEHLFQPLITSSRSPLLECDVYGHKNNNTYFTDHDIARTHLLCTLFSTGIEKIRGSVTMNGLSGKKRSAFTIPLGAVCCSFRKELRPYEQYDMWTRILSWDEKWIYVVTHFIKKGTRVAPNEITLYPQQKAPSAGSKKTRSDYSVSLDPSYGSEHKHIPSQANTAIAASAMSKLVFKDGRVTIAPEILLEASGLLPPKASVKSHGTLVAPQLQADQIHASSKATEKLYDAEESDNASDSGYESAHRLSGAQAHTQVTREAIEAERVRGLRIAKMLAAQTDLEHEFRSEVALGRHYDGYGVEGVVATLIQLGKLGNYQLL